MIKIGIMGYGNLGRGIECAIKQNDDLELVAVFTRRDPATVSILTEGAAVCNVKDVEDWKDKIDVLMLCGGSATDRSTLERRPALSAALTPASTLAGVCVRSRVFNTCGTADCMPNDTRVNPPSASAPI